MGQVRKLLLKEVAPPADRSHPVSRARVTPFCASNLSLGQKCLDLGQADVWLKDNQPIEWTVAHGESDMKNLPS